jgi:hypothetical protein
MDQISTAVGQCYDWSMPYGVSIHGEKDFDTNGDIHNLQLAQRLEMLPRYLVIYGKLKENNSIAIEQRVNYFYCAL